MSCKPFLKWAGGKRWLFERTDFKLPPYGGRYIEPFLGGGAAFFSLSPKSALLSDANPRLIEVYRAIKFNWEDVFSILQQDHGKHNAEYYYKRRSQTHDNEVERAAQFIYLNRSCWNGLYRVNQLGQFNVPIGTKNWVVSADDNFERIAMCLSHAELISGDFETTVDMARESDLIFADPPYTVAHNLNGFVKYNESIFKWDDQIRLRDSLLRASQRGVTIILTNADHPSVRALYENFAEVRTMNRKSVISGKPQGRSQTTELLIRMV